MTDLFMVLALVVIVVLIAGVGCLDALEII
jgi:hypothetical protein